MGKIHWLDSGRDVVQITQEEEHLGTAVHF